MKEARTESACDVLSGVRPVSAGLDVLAVNDVLGSIANEEKGCDCPECALQCKAGQDCPCRQPLAPVPVEGRTVNLNGTANWTSIWTTSGPPQQPVYWMNQQPARQVLYSQPMYGYRQSCPSCGG